MNDTQFQIDHLIELAVLQRAELKQLVDSMPQLRDHLSEEIERNLEEAEPAIRSELEQLVIARANDEHAKISVALTAKIDELAKALEITTAAKYSVLMAERVENANLLAKAEARIEDAASMLTHAVKEIVTDELSRFPRAGEIDQLRKEFAEPRGLNPRGRWMPDETYQRLDLVTINGDSFVSNIDGNRERPSRTAGDWTLSAARGNGGGGGGVTSMTDLVPVPSNGQLLIGNGSAFVNSTLTAGTGIAISNGAGSITISATDGNITLDDGTAAAPSLNFTNEPTTGLFRASANVMGFAVAGVSRATMTTTGVTVTGTITPTGSVHAAAGSVGNPSLAFDADQDTGLFRIGANNLGVAAGGAKVLDVATTGLGVTGTLSVSGVATLGAGAILNTPASGTLTNATGLPISTGVSGLGANVAAFLATPSSANLAAALTDETGTGANVFATSPMLTTPISATLTSPAATNLTLGLGTGGTALTLTSSTLAATFAGAITTTANNNALVFSPATLTAQVYQTFNSSGGTSYFGQESSTGGGIITGSAAYSLSISSASGRNLNLGVDAGVSAMVIATSTRNVSISSTTAGSAGAGALVVTGGLATGAASYFGGAVTVSVPGVVISENTSSSSDRAEIRLTKSNGTAQSWAFSIAGASDGFGRADGTFSIQDNTTGSVKFSLLKSTGAATFAGAVTVGGALAANSGISFAGEITKNGHASGYLVAVSDTTNNGFYWDDNAKTINIFTASGAGAVSLNQSGALSVGGAATFGGTVIAPAATTSIAPLRIPHGTAPTSPTNGDMWSTTAGLFIRINGVTKTVTLI